MSKAHQHCASKLGIDTLLIFPDCKDSKWWLCLKPRVLAAVYKKSTDGTVSILPASDSELRMVSKMILDGLSYEDILEILPNITERQYHFIYQRTTSRNVKI